ncbi:MAG: hypothetical protein Kow0056_06500 [Coriobacteriia bacterium]
MTMFTHDPAKEASVTKRILVMAVLVTAVLALVAAPALAEGYNTTITSRDANNPSGPHGGYNSTTNKCQDCHSTHYATGSYVLLRANSREAACDYCHAGGGGSSLNIQMDNDYGATSVETTTSRGYGTGHTLGYAGNAPVDINPAFADSQGLACFDCHTPHGNSARVLTTFANPGRAFQPVTYVVYPYGGGGSDGLAAFIAAGGTTVTVGSDVYYDLGTVNDTVTLWGLTPGEGNIVLAKGGDGKGALKKPIWPTGRFLLLKNPDNETSGTVAVSDTTTGTAPGSASQVGYNKLAIDWDAPYGPADAGYGGDQDRDYNKALPWNPAGVTGLMSVNEFCTDCHDGAAGASTQQATVWVPDASTNDTQGAYQVAYSHDAQPRH